MAAFAAAATVCAPAPAHTDAPARAAVRTEARPDGTALLVTLTGRASPPRAFFLPSPRPRFVLDFAPLEISPAPLGPSALIAGLRQGRKDAGTARLVADLRQEAVLVRMLEERVAGGRRFTYLLAASHAGEGGDRDGGGEPAGVLAGGPETEAPPLPSAQPAKARVIVIDAGHGGEDPGAVRAGVREKDLTLAAALAVRAALQRRGGYEVVLTREGDAFLPLAKRVEIARARKADLFLSLHADASPKPEVRGAAVYTLSERGGARARRVADGANWTLDLDGPPSKPAVRSILLELAQRETSTRSGDFAAGLLQTLQGAAPLLRNSHRSAGFYVLLAPDVPAVLLELGFLSNAEDAARLADPKARARVAEAIAEAVAAQFEKPQLFAVGDGARASFAHAGRP